MKPKKILKKSAKSNELSKSLIGKCFAIAVRGANPIFIVSHDDNNYNGFTFNNWGMMIPEKLKKSSENENFKLFRLPEGAFFKDFQKDQFKSMVLDLWIKETIMPIIYLNEIESANYNMSIHSEQVDRLKKNVQGWHGLPGKKSKKVNEKR